MIPAQPDPGLFEQVQFFPGERAVLAKPEDLSPAQWAEKYIVITKGPWKGPYRIRRTPYHRGPLDLYSLPWVRDVVCMFGDQMGKSLLGRIVSEYSLTRNEGAVGILAGPDEASGKIFIENNVAPILKKSPYLKTQLAPSRAITSKRVRYRNGSYFDLAYSGSDTSFAHTGREFGHATEVDKWAESKKETSLVEQLKARARTYRDSYKFIWESTPTVEQGGIWLLINECSVVYTLLAMCPRCGEPQPLLPDQVHYPEGVSPTEIEEDLLGRFQCRECGELWTDLDRDEAVDKGIWAPGRFEELDWTELDLDEIPERPKKIGFWLPAYTSAVVSLSQSAAAKCAADNEESVAKKKAWFNKHAALPYVDLISDRKVDQILALKDERKRGEFPAGCVALLGSVDPHKYDFHFTIRAYRPGVKKIESYLVREGVVRTEAELQEALIEADYVDGNGEIWKVECATLDTGNQTGEMYRMCDRWGGFLFAVKGASGRQARPVSHTTIDIDPETKKPIPGGLTLWKVDVHHYKDELAHMIADLPESPPSLHLHSEVDKVYAKHMTAETKDGDLWVNPREAANHFWDCEVYNLALHTIRGVKFRPDPAAEKPAPKPKPKPKKSKKRSSRW